MTKERIEDLGRIAVLMDNLVDHPLFVEERMAAKNFPSWFMEQDSEKQELVLRSFAYGLEAIEEALYNIRDIAKGVDSLNEKDYHD